MKLIPRTVAFSDEPWTTIRLDDGTVIRIRLNITKIEQGVEDDGQPMLDAAGNPQFNVKWATATDIEPGTNANVS